MEGSEAWYVEFNKLPTIVHTQNLYNFATAYKIMSDFQTFYMLMIGVLVVLSVGLSLGMATFKLFQSIWESVQVSSDGGIAITEDELSEIKSNMNMVAKLFFRLAEESYKLYKRLM